MRDLCPSRCVSRAFSAQKDFINKVDEIFIRDIYLIFCTMLADLFPKNIWNV